MLVIVISTLNLCATYVFIYHDMSMLTLDTSIQHPWILYSVQLRNSTRSATVPIPKRLLIGEPKPHSTSGRNSTSDPQAWNISLPQSFLRVEVSKRRRCFMRVKAQQLRGGSHVRHANQPNGAATSHFRPAQDVSTKAYRAFTPAGCPKLAPMLLPISRHL